MKRRTLNGLITASAFGALAGPIRSFAASDSVKVGVVTDMSGIYADLGGIGQVIATQLAIDEFNGEILGKKIEILQGNDQNKTNVAIPVMKRWISEDHVNMITGPTNSAIGLAAQEIATDTKTIFMYSGASSSKMVGASCSPYGIQYVYNSYALSAGAVRPLLAKGYKKWFFIAVDYAYGHSMVDDASKMIKDGDGTVVGAVYHPLGTSDFSSYLLRAMASDADVIGIVNSGQDFINSVTQADKMGLRKTKKQLAGFLVSILDVKNIGLEHLSGLTYATAFYWNYDARSREFAKKFFAKHKKMPTMQQAGTYSAVMTYLLAVKAVGSTDSVAVRKKLGEMNIDDNVIRNGRILWDGSGVHDMYQVRVKSPNESKGPWDILDVLSVVPPDQAFQPADATGCKIKAS